MENWAEKKEKIQAYKRLKQFESYIGTHKKSWKAMVFIDGNSKKAGGLN